MANGSEGESIIVVVGGGMAARNQGKKLRDHISTANTKQRL